MGLGGRIDQSSTISIQQILQGKWEYNNKVSILLNVMFHAPIGRFQLELINYFTYFHCRLRQKKLQHPQDLLKMLY